jgi:hypothetical protein
MNFAISSAVVLPVTSYSILHVPSFPSVFKRVVEEIDGKPSSSPSKILFRYLSASEARA